LDLLFSKRKIDHDNLKLQLGSGAIVGSDKKCFVLRVQHVLRHPGKDMRGGGHAGRR
jgi:hypothetical protein